MIDQDIENALASIRLEGLEPEAQVVWEVRHLYTLGVKSLEEIKQDYQTRLGLIHKIRG